MSVVPDSVVTFLLNHINQILAYNYHLIADAKGNFLGLRQEVKILTGLMKDFAEYNHGSHYLKELVDKIRSKIHEAEDAVDTYVVLSAVQKSRPWYSQASHFIDYPLKLREVAQEISKAITEVKNLQEDIRNGISMLRKKAVNHQSQPAKSKAVRKVEEEHVIGFERAAEDVSRLITGGPEQFEVISIVGMLGLGKTTLAKKVFKNLDVDDSPYKIRAFINVSREYEKREVFLDILKSFTTQISDEVSKMKEEQLEKHLHDQLEKQLGSEGNQFLIVLDDVCSKEDWNELKDAFPNDKKKRCRVLITTSSDRVAEDANSYKLEFLPIDKSLEVLRWKVFNENKSLGHLKEYEIQIAEKCDGLPMAIMAIARVFKKGENSGRSWMQVAFSVNDYIARDKEINEVIELMYVHLQNPLKQCFIFLGVFPEGFEIPVWKLVRLWIAEGLIQQEGRLNLEDMAEEYLEELVDRNLVILVKRRSNGKTKTCRIHNTLREFCKKKAREENLFQEFNMDELSNSSDGNSALDQCRRLCVNNVNDPEQSFTAPSGNCIRSVLIFGKKNPILAPNFVPSIPRSFKLVRVLEIQSLDSPDFPDEFSNLVLLKYVAVTSSFSILPWKISQMWNMQTLIVITSCPSLVINADIWKIPHLKHLHTNVSTYILPYHDTKKKKKKKRPLVGKNLQTLSTLAPESCRQDVFDQTPNLRKLGIRGKLTVLLEVKGEYSLFGNLQKLERLENLKLLNDDRTSRLFNLPSEERFPKQLTTLTLSNTLLEWKEMSTLGKLPKLEVLKLKDDAFHGPLWRSEMGDFQCLGHLHIGRTNLLVWEVASIDHFPSLKSLKLQNCEKLQGVPRRLADISSLQLVVLESTNLSAVRSARRLQVWKLQRAQLGSKNSVFKLSVSPDF